MVAGSALRLPDADCRGGVNFPSNPPVCTSDLWVYSEPIACACRVASKVSESDEPTVMSTSTSLSPQELAARKIAQVRERPFCRSEAI